MSDLFLNFVLLSLSMIPIILFLWLFSRYDRVFSYRCKYVLWLLVLLRLLVPVNPTIPSISLSPPELLTDTYIQLPITGDPDFVDVAAVSADGTPAIPQVQIHQDPTDGSYTHVSIPTLYMMEWFIMLWAIGAILSLFIQLIGITAGSRRLRKNRAAIRDEAILTELSNAAKQLHIRHTPKIFYSPNADSPMLMGIIRPVILLPETFSAADMSSASLSAVLAHELYHRKRCDIGVKFLCIFIRAIHWFNPAVYLAASRMESDMELSCDEGTLRIFSGIFDEKIYSETMMSLIKQSRNHSGTTLSTSFHAQKSTLMKRFDNIFAYSKKKWGTPIVLVGLLLVLCTVFVSCSTEENPDNSADESAASEAAQIASLKEDLQNLQNQLAQIKQDALNEKQLNQELQQQIEVLQQEIAEREEKIKAQQEQMIQDNLYLGGLSQKEAVKLIEDAYTLACAALYSPLSFEIPEIVNKDGMVVREMEIKSNEYMPSANEKYKKTEDLINAIRKLYIDDIADSWIRDLFEAERDAVYKDVEGQLYVLTAAGGIGWHLRMNLDAAELTYPLNDNNAMARIRIPSESYGVNGNTVVRLFRENGEWRVGDDILHCFIPSTTGVISEEMSVVADYINEDFELAYHFNDQHYATAKETYQLPYINIDAKYANTLSQIIYEDFQHFAGERFDMLTKMREAADNRYDFTFGEDSYAMSVNYGYTLVDNMLAIVVHYTKSWFESEVFTDTYAYYYDVANDIIINVDSYLSAYNVTMDDICFIFNKTRYGFERINDGLSADTIADEIRAILRQPDGTFTVYYDDYISTATHSMILEVPEK